MRLTRDACADADTSISMQGAPVKSRLGLQDEYGGQIESGLIAASQLSAAMISSDGTTVMRMKVINSTCEAAE